MGVQAEVWSASSYINRIRDKSNFPFFNEVSLWPVILPVNALLCQSFYNWVLHGQTNAPYILAVSLNRENSNFKPHGNPYQTLQSSPDYPSDPSNKFDANPLHKRRSLNQTA